MPSKKVSFSERSDGQISINIPLKPKVRSGRKIITLPNDDGPDCRPWDGTVTPLQQALIRAHQWEEKLSSGACSSVKELAAKEGVDKSYVSRIINLTILAPDIVKAILDENVPEGLTLFELGADTPRSWVEQREKFGI